MLVNVGDYAEFPAVVSSFGNPTSALYATTAGNVSTAWFIYPDRGLVVRYEGSAAQPAEAAFLATYPSAILAPSATLNSLA